MYSKTRLICNNFLFEQSSHICLILFVISCLQISLTTGHESKLFIACSFGLWTVICLSIWWLDMLNTLNWALSWNLIISWLRLKEKRIGVSDSWLDVRVLCILAAWAGRGERQKIVMVIRSMLSLSSSSWLPLLSLSLDSFYSPWLLVVWEKKKMILIFAFFSPSSWFRSASGDSCRIRGKGIINAWYEHQLDWERKTRGWKRIQNGNNISRKKGIVRMLFDALIKTRRRREEDEDERRGCLEDEEEGCHADQLLFLFQPLSCCWSSEIEMRSRRKGKLTGKVCFLF